MRTGFFAGLLSLGLAACSEQQQQVVDISTIPQIQADLKRQIGVYIAAVAARQADLKTHPADQATYWCGNGSLDFQITSVKLDLTTSLDKSDTISGSATVPLVTGSVGPSVSGASDVANSQELTFTEYAFNPAAQPDEVRHLSFTDKDLASAPIAQSLLGLRNGLIAAARKSPMGAKGPQACFAGVPIETLLKDADPAKAGAADSGNSFKLGVTITNSASEGIMLKLGVVSLGNTFSQKMVASNSITVGFKAVRYPAPAIAAPARSTTSLDSGFRLVALTQVIDPPPPDPCKNNPDPPPACYGQGPYFETQRQPPTCAGLQAARRMPQRRIFRRPSHRPQIRCRNHPVATNRVPDCTSCLPAGGRLQPARDLQAYKV